jgi:hypothetical protein
MTKKVLILLLIFVLSRIIFINPLPVFFDSPEYLSRFADPNYLHAISSGHIPFHAGYIALFWPIYHLATVLNLNPAYLLIFAQILLSAVAIYCFNRLVETISNKKTAFLATIVAILFPIYWITNVSIMTESTYINYFLISLLFFSLYAKNKYSTLGLIIGCILLGLSLLTNPLVILWLPFLLLLINFLKKEMVIKVFCAVTITTCITVFVNGFLVAGSLQIPLSAGIHRYLFGEDLSVIPNVSSFLTILRFIRNALLPIIQNNTIIVLLLTVLSVFKLYKTNKKLFMATLFWILPLIMVNQWYNPLLSGRHGIIAEFGLAFLSAIYLEKKKILTFIVIGYILVISLPALVLLKQPIPYLEEQKYVINLPKGLLIDTHLARPQIQGYYHGTVYFVNEPSESENLGKIIDRHLASNIPVFITSQALSDPYGLYSGPYLYALSLSYANKFQLEGYLPYLINKYALIDNDANIIIFKIVSKENTKYPDVPNLSTNRRRIDYLDPLNQLWFFMERAKIIQSQNIIRG